MGFVRRTITKMADKNGSHLSVGFCGHSTLPNCFKFVICITSIKLWFKFKYHRFRLTKNKQVGRQNGRCRSVCFCGHSTLVIYNPKTSKFHIWITFTHSQPIKFEYGLCRIAKLATNMAATCTFALNLVIYHLISSKLNILITFNKHLPSLNMGFV